MESYIYYSYLAGALSYFTLLLWSLPRINKTPIAISFLIAVVFSLLWSGAAAYFLYSNEYFAADSLPYETLRNVAWFFLLGALISRQQFDNSYALFFNSRPVQFFFVFICLIFLLEISDDLLLHIKQIVGEKIKVRLIAHLIFSVIGLVLVEQVYRNAVTEQRWAVKFLCIGLGSLFIVDFIVYSKSLLFMRLDSVLWNSRGLLNALIAPLLAIAIRRLQDSDVTRITLSRKIVFHSTVMLGAGVYLILMSIAGFYIRDYGGTWGGVAQIVFIFLAALLLLVLFASGTVRANFKFFIGKHFFHYRYDYRDEWLKLSRNIADLHSFTELSGFIIKTMMELADSAGGGLWLKNEQGDFYLSEQKNLGFAPPPLISAGRSSIKFMIEKKWVLDFVEFANTPEIYAGVNLSELFSENKKVWIIIPLFQQNDLEAFVVLTQAKIHRALNWEDRDLLKTVGMQLANALALNNASDALSRSKQFEAYNRISAYLVHDLKNLVAQVTLIVKNAEKHKRNPEFIDDSIETLKNVVNKIEHILGQLKKGNINIDQKEVINLVEIVKDVAIQQAANRLSPQVVNNEHCLEVVGEKQKFIAILGHLVQNAQDATPDDGFVRLELGRDGQQAVIKVIDNGVGMDTKFIAERLFKPFDTTKGNAGMGIGVYETRDYITKQGGSCIVESQPGVGTCFTIKLPLANAMTGVGASFD